MSSIMVTTLKQLPQREESENFQLNQTELRTRLSRKPNSSSLWSRLSDSSNKHIGKLRRNHLSRRISDFRLLKYSDSFFIHSGGRREVIFGRSGILEFLCTFRCVQSCHPSTLRQWWGWREILKWLLLHPRRFTPLRRRIIRRKWAASWNLSSARLLASRKSELKYSADASGKCRQRRRLLEEHRSRSLLVERSPWRETFRLCSHDLCEFTTKTRAAASGFPFEADSNK